MFSQEQTVNALLASVRSEIGLQPQPGFVVFTGDLAFSGQRGEYQAALPFLAALSDATGVDPRLFFFVPGNHDVERDRHVLAFHGGRAIIDSPQAVDRVLSSTEFIAPLKDRQSEFWEFVNSFTAGQIRTTTEDGLGYVAKLELGRLVLSVIALNSAWLSGSDNEEMRLLIGERQVINALNGAKVAWPHFVLALAHHPIGYLTEWDAVCCRKRLLPAADLYLRGHLHAHEVSLMSTPAQPCVEIAAGSGHATRFYENSYNFSSIDLTTGLCSVQPYRFLPADGKFVPAEASTAQLTVRGEIPGSREAIAAAIASSVPSVAQYSGFMGGLLAQHLIEVPVALSGKVEFLAPSIAVQLADEDGFTSLRGFIGLRNLLKIYAPAVGLDARIRDHVPILVAFGRELDKLISIDPSCATRLRLASTAPSEPAVASWSAILLEDLQASEDWPQLERQARFISGSMDETARRLGRSYLVEALLHSDEGEKRDEAWILASQMAADAPNTREVLLSAAAAETVKRDPAAVEIVVQALNAGNHDPAILEYASKLALRTGDRSLRDVVEHIKTGEPA